MKTLEVGSDTVGEGVGVEIEGVAILGAIDQQPGASVAAGLCALSYHSGWFFCWIEGRRIPIAYLTSEQIELLGLGPAGKLLSQAGRQWDRSEATLSPKRIDRQKLVARAPLPARTHQDDRALFKLRSNQVYASLQIDKLNLSATVKNDGFIITRVQVT